MWKLLLTSENETSSDSSRQLDLTAGTIQWHLQECQFALNLRDGGTLCWEGLGDPVLLSLT